MNYDEWIETVPMDLRGDPLWNMEIYQLAVLMGDLAWSDLSKLVTDRRTRSLADQLYRAIGSIAANIAEGYSRRSGKDQARFYEYALGSAREARGWYYQGKGVLHTEIVTHRLQLLTRIIRLLLKIIPRERGFKLQEPETAYTPAQTLLSHIPLVNANPTDHATRTTKSSSQPNDS